MQQRNRSRYPHIAWSILPLVVLIAGLVLKASLSEKVKVCDSVLGRVTRVFIKSTQCDTVATWNQVSTFALWLGGFLLVGTLVGGLLRMAETNARLRADGDV